MVVLRLTANYLRNVLLAHQLLLFKIVRQTNPRQRLPQSKNEDKSFPFSLFFRQGAINQQYTAQISATLSPIEMLLVKLFWVLLPHQFLAKRIDN